MIYSKEHRKETSVNSYIPINSAHPRGIVKSQLYRLRRLYSRDTEFRNSVEDLRIRCLRSGYKKDMVQSILNQSDSLAKTLTKPVEVNVSRDHKIDMRLVILSGTSYEKEFMKFAKQMNSTRSSSNFKVEIVKSTAPTIGQYLFNNNNNNSSPICECHVDKCVVCPNDIQNKSGIVKSTFTEFSYKVDKKLTCNEGGIYVIQGACSDQYTGRTINYGNRGIEHFKKSKLTSIYDHKNKCHHCNIINDFTVTYVGSYLSNGKYSLSEREMLRNERIKGRINVQKTLKS